MSLLQWLRDRLATANPAAGADADGDDDVNAELDPFNPFPEPIPLEITDVFDLHSIAPRDVGRAVEAYLEEARRAGFRSVRLVHGRGKGVQRATVRKILARTPFVAGFADAPPQSGGWGATVAHLLPENESQEAGRGGS